MSSKPDKKYNRRAQGVIRKGPMMDDDPYADPSGDALKRSGSANTKIIKKAPKKGIIKPIRNGRRNKGKWT